MPDSTERKAIDREIDVHMWTGSGEETGIRVAYRTSKNPKVISTSPEAERSQDSLSNLREAALCHLQSGLEVPVWHSTILLLEP